MKAIFKSSVVSAVSLAVAGACGFAVAGTLSGPAANNNMGLEFIKARATNTSSTRIQLPVLSFVTGSSYGVNDELTLTLSSGDFSLASGTHSDVTCGTVGAGTPHAVLQFMNTSGRSATFKVASLSGNTTGISCAFGSLAVLASSYSSLAATTAITAQTSARSGVTGSTFDATAATAYFSVKAELGTISVTSGFNAVVDYASKLGRAFTADENTVLDGSGDKFAVNVAQSSTNFIVGNTATFTTVKFSITAPKGLSFMNIGGTTCGAAPSSGSATGTGKVSAVGGDGSVTLSGADCGTINFVKAASAVSGAANAFDFAIGTSAASPTIGAAIQPQSFGTTVVTVEYTDSATGRGSASSEALDVGTWTSNGQAAVIPYMPSNTSATNKKDVVVYITNRSSVTGTATATVYGNEVGANNVITEKSATSACTVALGTIAPNSTTNVSATLRTGIDTCWGAGKDYRVAVEIQTTLPTSSTTVYSGFTVGTDRVNVINDTNGK